jgi:hypothetical protein
VTRYLQRSAETSFIPSSDAVFKITRRSVSSKNERRQESGVKRYRMFVYN